MPGLQEGSGRGRIGVRGDSASGRERHSGEGLARMSVTRTVCNNNQRRAVGSSSVLMFNVRVLILTPDVSQPVPCAMFDFDIICDRQGNITNSPQQPDWPLPDSININSQTVH